VPFILKKMIHSPGEVLQYRLGDLELNRLLGQEIRLRATGRIFCLACHAAIRKTYGDGLCYPCFSSLAVSDSCIIKPHTCHFAQGTCRQPEWGLKHCFRPHVVYLALTSGLKVGVTSAQGILTRWGDQGAVGAVILARTPDRLTAGKIEVFLAGHMSDRSNWRKLITTLPEPVDLATAKIQAAALLPAELRKFVSRDDPVHSLVYPIHRFLPKARSARLDKESEIRGSLEGIRGQYLLFPDRALNVRRHSGFEISLD